VIPAARITSADRNKENDGTLDAGIKRSAPAVIVRRPVIMVRLKPNRSTSFPAGRAKIKYEEKNANWTSIARVKSRSKMALRLGIITSFREVRKPHMKKRDVAMLIARTSVPSQSGA
jgi:hypothetical protein